MQSDQPGSSYEITYLIFKSVRIGLPYLLISIIMYLIFLIIQELRREEDGD